MPASALPIDAVLPDLIRALRERKNAVLRAPTGAGKTTRVPPALLDAGLAGGGSVVMLEPRRLAARAAARRIAFEREVELGREVGYHVRFDKRARRDTRILVVTEGILVRRLQDDPFLEGVGCVVFDELHERGLDTDLSLAMVRKLQREARPDLALVAMSATIVPGAVAEFLGGAAVVESEGRLFPVDVRHVGRDERAPLAAEMARNIARALDATKGSVLAFLPGVGEIRRARSEIESACSRRGVDVRELYGDLPPDEQDAALRGGARRRVVLATNVAQTSVTVEGVTAVVDCGLARVLRFDASVGLDRLQVERISRASADQRAGRAGRTEPGVCLRLWSEGEERSMRDEDEPEIRRVDLAGAVLQLACWGERDVAAFAWLEAPPRAAVERALELLRRLGAIDDGGATKLGQRMAEMPVHPRLARLLLEGERLGAGRRAALAAALLSERDAFIRSAVRTRARHASDSDLADRVAALEAFERAGRTSFDCGAIAPGAAAHVLRTAEALERLVRTRSDRRDDDALARAVLAAFPDRVARRREKGSRRAVLASGRGASLADESAVTDPELFVAVEIDAGARGERAEALVRVASAVAREWLASGATSEAVEVAFDEASERVTAVRRVRYGDLVLDEAQVALPEGEAVARSLAEAASSRFERVFPRDDRDLEAFLARVRSLREWMPELGLPGFDDADLRALLPELCTGRRSFDELRRAPWLDCVRTRLTHAQRQALDREAPERVEVPSGSRIALRYEPGRRPVLAVRIQELFGLADTPRIAGGRVPLLVHLLAPNHRPEQITDDLRSFWTSTYPKVRSELRRRYPKHAWPEDPWTAPPQRGPRRRSP